MDDDEEELRLDDPREHQRDAGDAPEPLALAAADVVFSWLDFHPDSGRFQD